MERRNPIPFSVVIWREILSLHEFRGMAYALFDDLLHINIFLVVFCLPFMLPVFLFRDILAWKYTFHPDRIVKHYLIGFTRSIPKEQVFRVTDFPSDRKVQIQWRKKPRGRTQTITLLYASLRNIIPGGGAEASLLFMKSYLKPEE